MSEMALGAPSGPATTDSGLLDQIPRAAGVERQWFFSDPPPLPNRHAVPDDWQRLFYYIEDNPSGGMEFRPPDVFKAWNSAFAGDPCKHHFLRHAPGQLYLYDPVDGAARPPYRYMPNATLPNGLVTNQMGWRGAPIENPRGDKTIRIVFVGASTTLGSPNLPFSYPELVGYWLNRWAESKRLAVRFEALNAGRESIVSTDTAAIVRTEVLPLRPDLVVYYEGGNQFNPGSIVDGAPKKSALPPPQPHENASPTWLQTASRYSALAARIRAAVGIASSNADGKEWPKPDYRVVWPANLDETNPDLDYPNLPANLGAIQRDLDRIRADLATVGSDLALSSFMWMVKDGLVLDPLRHKYILEQLNIANFPYRYRELERLSQFQNRLLAKYAKVHGLTFIDTARYLPFDPDLFIDALHMNYAGLRLQAWVTFNQLLPTIEKHLADRSWPRPRDPAASSLPTITPRKIKFTCQ